MLEHASEGGAVLRIVSDADRQRAEVDRFEAESRKLTLEADQIEKEMALPFFRRSGFVKAAAAGIVALPLMWFYLDKIVVPYQTSLSAENAKKQSKLDELTKDLATRSQALGEYRQKLDETEKKLKGTVQALQTTQDRDSSELEKLKRADKEAKGTAKIRQMQNDLARRDQELGAAFSSLARIREELKRSVPIAPVSIAAATPIPAAMPEPVISGATVVLTTTKDDKDDDAYVSIVINSAAGEMFTWQEDNKEQWDSGFKKTIHLEKITAPPLSLLKNPTIKICMKREKEHGWKFDYTGSLLVDDKSVLSFERKGNTIAHGAGLTCVESPLR